jgi:hypothetical protein
VPVEEQERVVREGLVWLREKWMALICCYSISFHSLCITFSWVITGVTALSSFEFDIFGRKPHKLLSQLLRASDLEVSSLGIDLTRG